MNRLPRYNGSDLSSFNDWEGRILDGAFPLHQYLSGTENGAVFLTEHDSRKALIKLIPADQDAKQLYRWQAATQLVHPHLIRLFRAGQADVDGGRVIYAVIEYADENL